MPLFQEATERKILVEILKESIKPAPDIITNPDEIPCMRFRPLCNIHWTSLPIIK